MFVLNFCSLSKSQVLNSARTKIINTVPVVLEDLKTIDVQQADDGVMLVGVVLLEKQNSSSYLSERENSVHIKP